MPNDSIRQQLQDIGFEHWLSSEAHKKCLETVYQFQSAFKKALLNADFISTSSHQEEFENSMPNAI